MARLTWSAAERLNTSEEAYKELRALKGRSLEDGSIWQVFSNAIYASSGRMSRWVPACVAVVLLICSAVWMWNPLQSNNGMSALSNGDRALTAIGEISSYTLPDGSKVIVNADSAVRVAFTKDRRQIFLERGQAFFDVQHDTVRPFAVISGTRTIVVTGTKFDVEYDSHRRALQVAVIDGHVNVGDDSSKVDGVTALHANDVFEFSGQGPPTRLPLAANLVSAWQIRQLYFEGTTVGDVLFSVNRFALKRLQLTDPSLADLPLSGMFVAGDTDAVLFSLNALYGIEATDGGDVLILHK